MSSDNFSKRDRLKVVSSVFVATFAISFISYVSVGAILGFEWILGLLFAYYYHSYLKTGEIEILNRTVYKYEG